MSAQEEVGTVGTYELYLSTPAASNIYITRGVTALASCPSLKLIIMVNKFINE